MPKLTDDEKVVARAFRDAAQAKLVKLNHDDPKDYDPPNFLVLYRHLCPARNDKSTAMELKEKYLFSLDPIPVEDQLPYKLPGQDEYSPVAWPGGTDRFGFIYREGKCRCGKEARSPAGRLVDAHDRPPTEGKISRSASA